MRPGGIKQRDVAPVQTFAKAAAKCSSEARIYGQCVTANYENIERNMCQKEFIAFKACVQQRLGRKW